MLKPGLTLAFLICLLVVPAAAGGCAVAPKGPQSSPQKLVEAYLEAFKNGDFDGMLSLSTGWKGSEEELAFTRKFMEMIELQNYAIGPVERVSEFEALVEVSVTLVLFGQPRTELNRIRTIKKDGKWYVDGGIVE
jgi:hypothetical protein